MDTELKAYDDGYKVGYQDAKAGKAAPQEPADLDPYTDGYLDGYDSFVLTGSDFTDPN